jgi:hypothetical protein
MSRTFLAMAGAAGAPQPELADLFKDTLFDVLPYEGSLEIQQGLVVPEGSVVMTGVEAPWRPWRTAEASVAILKQLLGIKRKRAAPEPEEEAPPVAPKAHSDSEDSEASEDDDDADASEDEEDAESDDD